MIELVLTKDNPIVNDTLHKPGGSLEESIVKVLKPLGGLSNFVSKDDNIILKIRVRWCYLL